VCASVKLFDQQGKLTQMLFQIGHGIILRVKEQFLRIIDQGLALPALPQIFESLRKNFTFVDSDAVTNGRSRINEQLA
jgi:hypothetical protein